MEIALIVQAILFGALSSIVAKQKNRDPAGWFFLGLILGVFGFIASLIVEEEPDKQSDAGAFDPEEHDKKCPDCAERIKLEARVCRYCGHEFPEEDVREKVRNVSKAVKRQEVSETEGENKNNSVKRDMIVLALLALLFGGMFLFAFLSRSTM